MSSDSPAAHRHAPVFSRPLKVDDLPDEGLLVDIDASSDECGAIAEDIDLPGVGALSGHFRVAAQPGGRVRVEGQVTARVTQICVVSLDPFESDVTQPVEITFVRVAAPARAKSHARQTRHGNDRDAARREADVHASLSPVQSGEGEADPPDPIVDGRIDLGAVAIEFLTLALDFYPKKPGVHFSDVVIGDTDVPKPSAFAALERFKDRS